MTARPWGRAGAAAVATGICVALLGVVTGGTAEAHFLGHDSVDDCEIRWEDDTAFDTERQAAEAAWERLKGDNCVNLAPDTWSTVADLEWKDVYRSDLSWVGIYEFELGADDIIFNGYHMRLLDSCSRRMVAMHELGHAHGLDHNPYGNSVMGAAVVLPYGSGSGGTPVCSLGPHDIADYESLWGLSDPPELPSTTASTHAP